MPYDDDTAPLMLLVGKSAADRFGCALTAKTFALRVGLSPKGAEELAIAASELASNVIRHANNGTIALRVSAEPRRHILMVCRDQGPGIVNTEDARKDGYSRGHMITPDSRTDGLGKGLGAVERLVDELRIESVLGMGTTVTVRKWLR